MNQELLQRIVGVRKNAAAALVEPGHCPYLPVLLEYFELMEAIIRQGISHPQFPREERKKMIGGFGKIVLENYSFATSPLGEQMLDVFNSFVKEP